MNEANKFWGLYHKTYYIIYGFRNKLECLSLNTRLGWKGSLGTGPDHEPVL